MPLFSHDEVDALKVYTTVYGEIERIAETLGKWRWRTERFSSSVVRLGGGGGRLDSGGAKEES